MKPCFRQHNKNYRLIITGGCGRLWEPVVRYRGVSGADAVSELHTVKRRYVSP